VEELEEDLVEQACASTSWLMRWRTRRRVAVWPGPQRRSADGGAGVGAVGDEARQCRGGSP
jgi:hypothetical protein